MKNTSFISGIGGVFFRAKDPGALSKWYEKHFGMNPADSMDLWQQEKGPTVFAPFSADTEYFGRRDQQFMINFRVKDLDGFLKKLRETGVKIDEKIQQETYGKFAWVYVPEDNKIELWEPVPTQTLRFS